MRRRTLAALLIVVIALATSWYTRRGTGPEQVVTAPAHVPDYFLRNFTITQIGADGMPENRLEADYMVNFPDTDTAELEQPDITVFRQEGPPWRIQAATGHIDRPADRTRLDGGVTATRSGPDIEETEMVTEYLILHPDANTAETEARVTVTRPTSRMTGIGMRADLNSDEIALLSDVRGIHETR